MSSLDSEDDGSLAEGIDARVRRALTIPAASPRRRVLKRIAGRTPERLRDDENGQRFRNLAAAAAAILFVLALCAQKRDIALKQKKVDSSNVVAVVTPTDSDERSTKEGIFAELFAVEVPE